MADMQLRIENLDRNMRENVKEINALAVNLARLTSLVESNESRRNEDMALLRNAIMTIAELNEKIGVISLSASDMENIKERILQLEIWRTAVTATKNTLALGGKILWAVFGSGTTACIITLIKLTAHI